MVKVVVIGEDYERCLPLLQALDVRGVPVEMWNVSRGALLPTAVPDDAVYFCRQSPSAAARNHGASIPYVRQLLWWLHFHGKTVVNGLRALEMEMSKACQMAMLHSRGLNTPRTTLVATPAQLWIELSAASAPWPVILKPDTGGSGSGVQAFASPAVAAAAVREAAASVALEDIPPELWIVQVRGGSFV